MIPVQCAICHKPIGHHNLIALCNDCARPLADVVMKKADDTEQRILDATAAERESCCRDVCPWCKHKIPLYLTNPDGHVGWYHSGDGERFEQCKAAAIRARGEIPLTKGCGRQSPNIHGNFDLGMDIEGSDGDR